jgi:hypothetical protein
MVLLRYTKLIAITLLYVIAFFIHYIIIEMPAEVWACTIIIVMLILTSKSPTR